MKYFFVFAVLILLIACSHRGGLPVILYPENADSKVVLAAQEVRRYLYLRAGELLSIQAYSGQELPDEVIWLMVKGQNLPVGPLSSDQQARIGSLKPEAYYLSSRQLPADKRKVVLIAGGDAAGVLYGAYAFAEKLGVRFYLHSDVIPDDRIRFEISDFEEDGNPLFATRGIQPFHDFPEGPDWWSLEDYKAIFSQMVKMKMNFFGLHTYPEGGVGPEPLVWIGPPDQINDDGTVRSAYPARHFTTSNGTWSYSATKTSDYSHRLGEIFEEDSYGNEYMIGIYGWPTDARAEVDLFNRTGKFFGEAFGYAKTLGIKTCVGTETPLIVPKSVKERYPGRTTADYYTGMFEWIKRNYPVDYYWFWTPEDWTWSGNTPQHLQHTLDDLAAAGQAVATAGNPFQLATCGWVLGPVQDRSMFDQFLPKSWPMSCINQQVGFTPVDPGFARVSGRPLWAIPWMEDDPALTIMQLWAGRMRADASDALAYGCTGLIGIHWRTQTLQTQVSALARAGWAVAASQQPTASSKKLPVTVEQAEANFKRQTRDLPVDDFYADWALAQFGAGVADSMARIMVSLDGQEVSINAGGGKRTRLPRPGDWTGPGGVILDTLLWEQRAREYAFVDRIESWRPLVKGAGNLERFDYWLNFFNYHREFGKFACILGETERMLKELESDGSRNPEELSDEMISQRLRLMKSITDALGYLLAYASTPGDLGTIANWQQHLLTFNVESQAIRMEKLLGRGLPPQARPSKEMLDIRKMLVPTNRTMLQKGENMVVKTILYGINPQSAVVRYRLLGEKSYRETEIVKVGRSVYRAEIPSLNLTDDFEYHILVREAGGNVYRWPATAPSLNHTVVINR